MFGRRGATHSASVGGPLPGGGHHRQLFCAAEQSREEGEDDSLQRGSSHSRTTVALRADTLNIVAVEGIHGPRDEQHVQTCHNDCNCDLGP